ncbi:MAG: TraR/DksA family transcriptional regulator [Betaproteobacteria bacterium]|nr:TraR/DksA family transcriptional regulator [Betaproteobacteria bacterium]
MSHLSANEKTAVRAALRQERERLLAALKSALEESGQTQYAEVLGRASGDSSDEALAVTLGDLSAARVEHELRALKAIDAAKGRVEEAGFGLCEECDARIPVARLIANPAATRCVKCQDHFEHTFAGQAHASF